METWPPGKVVVRREVLGLGLEFPAGEPRPWLMQPWAAMPVYVVAHDAGALVAYIPPGAQLGVADGEWPTSDGRHPWHGRGSWQGHGVVMLHRPGDAYSVWHFWTGSERDFSAWYVNFQAPYVQTAIGFDTQDFELDLVVEPDGTWTLKDDELLDQRVAEGRFRAEHADRIRRYADDVTSQLASGNAPWDLSWRDWQPPASWHGTRLPPGWQQA